MEEPSSNSARGVLICANPFSGAGPNRRRVEALVAELSTRGLEPRLVWDIQERQALISNPGLASWCRCVVVAGGDGSIGAVVNELARAGGLPGPSDPGVDGQYVALATLPVGNENLFAKHYGFAGDVPPLADSIESVKTRRVDLGRVSRDGDGGEAGGHLFTLMAGVGFDAEVVHRMDRWRTAKKGGLKRVRRASYVPRIVSASLGYRYPGLAIEVDGQEFTGTHLFIFNLPEYGGGFGIAPPGCSGDSGLLDWVLFDRPGVLPLLGYAGSVLGGRHLSRRDVQHGRARRLAIRSVDQAPVPPVQIDGDPAGVLPVEVGIAEGAQLELLITR